MMCQTMLKIGEDLWQRFDRSSVCVCVCEREGGGGGGGIYMAFVGSG